MFFYILGINFPQIQKQFCEDLRGMKDLSICKELCGYFCVRAAGNENFIR